MVSVIHRINAAFCISPKFVPWRPNLDQVFTKLVSKKIELSELTFTKSYGGLYYSNDIQIPELTQIAAVTWEGINNIPNISFNVHAVEGNNYKNYIGIYVSDPSAPATLSFQYGYITVRVLGR